MQIYAPTSDASNDDIENFYSALENAITKIPNWELIIVGVFYVEIEANYQNLTTCTCNRRKRRTSDAVRNLVITNTLFQHHPRRQYTCTSPNGRYRTQIDYVWADYGSDHQLFISKKKLKLTSVRKPEDDGRKGHLEFQNGFRTELRIMEKHQLKWTNSQRALGKSETPHYGGGGKI